MEIKDPKRLKELTELVDGQALSVRVGTSRVKMRRIIHKPGAVPFWIVIYDNPFYQLRVGIPEDSRRKGWWTVKTINHTPMKQLSRVDDFLLHAYEDIGSLLEFVFGRQVKW